VKTKAAGMTLRKNGRETSGATAVVGPSGTERPMVITGPSSDPAVPPAPMKPNRRVPCSLVKRSAINDMTFTQARYLPDCSRPSPKIPPAVRTPIPTGELA
jgi:hypothetical protein